jgi:phosphoglycerol transferase MdoB-like AlkP superfamily enzyme
MAFSGPGGAIFAADSGWTVLLIAWLGGALLTLPLELLLRPASRLRERPVAAWCIHFGLWSLLFSVLLLLTKRPVFAAGAGLTTILLVVLVNNAKHRALQEPFLFSDFGLFSQALRHPRLYLPFLGVGPALTAAAAVMLAIYLGLTFEPPLPDRLGIGGFLMGTSAGLLLAAVLLGLGRRFAPAPSLLPHEDLRALGLAASLWLYWRLERQRPHQAETTLPFALNTVDTDHLPDIVAVQSESFCDGRRLWGGVRSELLTHFDRTLAGASRHGRLGVPAWGANTMRTEFGFLTGISADRLGVHRFNPYRRYARRPLLSLPALLKTLGYYTVCIHPHPASFFSRDRVYPQLGFDEFIDVRQFDRSDTCGPYICDAAVTRKIQQILDAATKPVFIFAITMENHGPLHLESVAPGDIEQLYTRAPPSDFSDLSVYLKHLLNADIMLSELSSTLGQHRRGGLLCWFGDHVPSMPRVYANTGYNDARTDYLIWRPAGGRARHQDLAVEQLAAALLAVAGLAGETTPSPARSPARDGGEPSR